MKQTKKLLAILLVGVSALAVGCGTTPKATGDAETTTESAVATDAAATTESPAATDAAATTESPAATDAAATTAAQ